MLIITDLGVRYGAITALRGLSMTVSQGEIVALVGPNGAGKTTSLRAVTGIAPISTGSIEFEGNSLVGVSPEAIVRQGISMVPEGRQIFTNLSVADNLRLGGAARRDRAALRSDTEAVLEKFPVLGRYYKGLAGQLSGGEQQQLAIARALLARPRLLILDEPSLGLAPRVVDSVFDILATLRSEGGTILLVEQKVQKTLDLADRTYICSRGSIVAHGTRDELAAATDITSAYLGLRA